MTASHQRPELGTDFTEVLTMNSFSMKHSQRLQTVWPIDGLRVCRCNVSGASAQEDWGRCDSEKE
jgi:hypothetical protein